MDTKVDKNKQLKLIYSAKHRELESLRLQDFYEHRNEYMNDKLKEKCDLVEKHIGMSIALNERKHSMQHQNDKLRNKMAKENHKIKHEPTIKKKHITEIAGSMSKLKKMIIKNEGGLEEIEDK